MLKRHSTYNEIPSLKLKCSKCKVKIATAFFRKKPFCKFCFTQTKYKQKHK